MRKGVAQTSTRQEQTMKLRHQILILLGLPVVCQIASVCLLGYSVAKVDEAANKERKRQESHVCNSTNWRFTRTAHHRHYQSSFLLTNTQKVRTPDSGFA